MVYKDNSLKGRNQVKVMLILTDICLLMPVVMPICFILFVAGWVQGVSGFGSALIAIPLLTLIIDIKTAVPLCALTSTVIATYMTLQLRHVFDLKKIGPLVMGAIPGIAVGVTLLKTVPSNIIQTLMGLFLMGYGLYNLFFTIHPRPLHRWWGYLSGFLSGAIGAAFGAGGPPAIIYTTLNNWTKNEIKATLSGFFCFASYFVITAHLISGVTTLAVGKLFLVSGPFVLLGTALGTYCYRFFKKSLYLKVVFGCLVVMGAMMMFIKN